MNGIQRAQEVMAKPAVTVSGGVGGIGIAEVAEALSTVGSIFQSLGFIAGGAVSMLVFWNYLYVNHLKGKKKK